MYETVPYEIYTKYRGVNRRKIYKINPQSLIKASPTEVRIRYLFPVIKRFSLAKNSVLQNFRSSRAKIIVVT